MEKIILFSSDARDLYKEDVFKAICLPKGYVIHFRYAEKYVDDSLLNNLSKYEKADAVIALTTGNDLTKPETERIVSNIPIREVKILQINRTKETGLVHFYLQLEDFPTIKIDSNNALEKLPAYKFASLLNVTESSAKLEWFQIVEKVKPHFSNQNFLSAKISGDILPHYDKEVYESYYLLNSEDNYVLDLMYYKGSDANSSIAIEVGGSSVSLDAPNNVFLGNTIDNRKFSLNTSSISVKELSSYIKFIPNKSTVSNESDFEVLLKIKLQRSWKSALIFGGLSTVLLFLATFKFIKDDSLKQDISGTSLIVFLVVGFFVVAGILAYLYQFFNKK
jgi:hypothetical protein